MRLSYYNFRSKCKPNSEILYNSKTGCMARLDQEHVNALNAFEKNGIDFADTSFADQLKCCGFLIDDDVSELDQIRYRLLQARFSSHLLSLIIAPTQDCNFRCTYCYEKDQLACGIMDTKTQNNILKFVEQRIHNISALNIQWYGGEPLLALDAIQYMSNAFLELCQTHHVRYSASMISNGYLLSEKYIHILNDCQVSSIQITLDGSQETHDRRRKTKDGGPTFATILSNLTKCKRLYNGKIALRMNVDAQNRAEINQLKNLLKDTGLNEIATMYLGKVTNINDTCEDSSCLGTCEYAQQNLSFMLEDTVSESLLKANYPRPLGNHCCADCNQAYVIGPNGSIYKCYSEIGCQDRAIGNINHETTISNYTLMHQYMLFDPTHNSKCSKCKFLPLCMGGCPKARMNGKQECTDKQHYLHAYMHYLSQSAE